MSDVPAPGEGRSRTARRRRRRKQQAADNSAATSEVSPLSMLKPRHMEVLNWMCEASGMSAHELVALVVKQAVIAEMPNYREAMGGGGGTTKNLEAFLG